MLFNSQLYTFGAILTFCAVCAIGVTIFRKKRLSLLEMVTSVILFGGVIAMLWPVTLILIYKYRERLLKTLWKE
jgi:hypothetical protein